MDSVDLERVEETRRNAMRAAAAKGKLTAMEFLRAYEGVEGRWELIDGVPVMMTGGTRRHAEVAGNIFAALKSRLGSGGCQTFGSDSGVQTGPNQIRYPDVSVYCDRRDLDSDPSQQQTGRYPSVVFEVLSISTRGVDYGKKLDEYQQLASLLAVVLVDVDQELIVVQRRTGGAGWAGSELRPQEPLMLNMLGVELAQAEVFAKA